MVPRAELLKSFIRHYGEHTKRQKMKNGKIFTDQTHKDLMVVALFFVTIIMFIMLNTMGWN